MSAGHATYIPSFSIDNMSRMQFSHRLDGWRNQRFCCEEHTRQCCISYRKTAHQKRAIFRFEASMPGRVVHGCVHTATYCKVKGYLTSTHTNMAITRMRICHFLSEFNVQCIEIYNDIFCANERQIYGFQNKGVGRWGEYQMDIKLNIIMSRCIVSMCPDLLLHLLLHLDLDSQDTIHETYTTVTNRWNVACSIQ